MQSYPTLLIKSGRITIASVPSGFCSVLFASVTRLLSISHQRWIIYIAVWILFIEFITIVSAFCSVTFASVTHSSSNQRLKTYHVATCILCIELFTLTLVPSVMLQLGQSFKSSQSPPSHPHSSVLYSPPSQY